MSNKSRTILPVLGLILGAAIGCERKAEPPQENPTVSPQASPNTSPDKSGVELKKIDDPKTEQAQAAAKAEPKDPLKEADADMKKVLEEMQSLGARSIATLSVEDARKQKTPGDAVQALLKKEEKDVKPLEMAKVEDKKVQTAGGPLAMRIYTPKTDDKKPLPVVVYYHGGGWVIADLNTYDASARALADESDAIVVAADYRHAPEHKFPAAHDDAFAAYQWTLKNAAILGGDPARIAVAGESAGGNLALNVAIQARDKGVQAPVHQLLIYPVAQTSTETEAYKEWENAKPLDKASMGWFVEKTLQSPEQKTDPRLSLVDANLKGLSPTTIILAEIDPLRSDGDMLAEKLKDAGVKVDKKTYEGVTHEFFGMGAYVSDAKAAEDYAGDKLENAFEKS